MLRKSIIALALALAIPLAVSSTSHAQSQDNLIMSVASDSYGSGNGADASVGQMANPSAYYPATIQQGQNSCLRSPNSGPQIAARLMGAGEIRDLACSSATPLNLLHEQQFNEGLQIEAFGQDTDLAVYGLGGNPAFFSLIKCIVTSLPALGQTCSQQEPALYGQVMQYFADQVPAMTRENLAAIRTASPDATLAVVLYPPLLPQQGSGLGNCAWFGDQGEITLAWELFDTLNNSLRTVAHEYGAVVVDPTAPDSPFWEKDAAGNGRDACSLNPDMASFWGPRLSLPLNPADLVKTRSYHDILNQVTFGLFHPDAKGHRLMGELIAQAFRESGAVR